MDDWLDTRHLLKELEAVGFFSGVVAGLSLSQT